MSDKPKPYKETHVENHYSKVYENESENGTVYPKNKVSIDSYTYEGEYENRDGENVAYSGEKYKITNSKLVLEDGQYVKAKKVVGKRAYNDETVAVLSESDFHDLVVHIKELDYQN